MKIGILTVYSFNYGSFFQATALYNQLQKLGHDVEFVNEKFKKYKWGNLFFLYSFDKFLPSFLKKYITRILPQYRTFLQLKKDVSIYKESPDNVMNMKEITKRYDLVIIGADEMWSASKDSIRYTKEHFGYNISVPHISYGTCGSLFNIKDKKLRKKAAFGLKTFKAISTRDEYTKKVAEKLTFKKVTKDLDPTLLNPYFVHEYSSEDEDYVLLYGQHYDAEQKEYIIKTAKRINAKIMSLGWPIDFADGFLDPASADEFQGCFARAKFCFPSTFHGTIFSILNHRPFISMSNELRGKKIKMLLKDLDLSYRIFNKNITNYKDIDYSAVDKLLESKRNVSLNNLISNINLCKKNKDFNKDFICSSDKCTSCGLCFNSCPFNAISMKEDEEGFVKPVIDYSKCKYCTKCKKICPVNNSLQENEYNQEIYAAYNIDTDIRISSSSGGIFYNLAKKIISDGGVVYGAGFENNIVKHLRVNDIDNLNILQGSKYVQSNIFNILDNIKNDLDMNYKVLFSGTPCQVRAVKDYTHNPDNLITIDILCHGVPSPRVFKDYITYMEKKYKSKISKISFRDKSFGWSKQAMKLTFENGKEYINTTDKDPYYVMYFSHVNMLKACNSCNYASFNRIGDISLGDFWGIDKLSSINEIFVKDKEKGISVVMANSVKGKDLLFNSSDLVVYLSNKEAAYQPILKSPSIISKNRSLFWQDYNDNGFEYIMEKYGKLSFISWIIKKIIVPLTKTFGIYDIVQKVYFGRNIRN